MDPYVSTRQIRIRSKKNPDPHIVFMILSQNDAGILGRKTQSETTFSETIWSEITTLYLVRKYFVRITSSGMALWKQTFVRNKFIRNNLVRNDQFVSNKLVLMYFPIFLTNPTLFYRPLSGCTSTDLPDIRILRKMEYRLFSLAGYRLFVFFCSHTSTYLYVEDFCPLEEICWPT